MPSNPFSSLSSNANTISQPYADKREYRYERRAQIQTFSRRKRIKRCGNVAVGPIELGVTGDVAHFRNLETCGNVWLCPVCSARVLAAREEEIANAIQLWTDEGKPFIFQTLTMSHTSGLSLSQARKAAFEAFSKTNSGRFAQVHKDYGQEGYLKVLEVTVGSNGWHLHFHVLRFINEWLPSDQLNDWNEKIFGKWRECLVSLGLKTPSRKYQDFQQVNVANELSGYFTKSYDNPKELATLALKNSSRGRTIWDLVPEAFSNPTSQDRRLWLEFEAASTGMRQISWAKGFRQRLGMTSSHSDEEISRNDNTHFEALLLIEPRDARKIGSMGRLASRVLRSLEQQDVLAACVLLSEFGITPLITNAGLQRIRARNFKT